MIRVLIIDDSAVVRKILTEELSKCEFINVVGSAIDPYVARDKIIRLNPDVITLDLEMPRMDGLSFLEKLMKHYPIPVVVVSSLTPKNSEMAIAALELGAVDVICKPGSTFSYPDTKQLVRAIIAANKARISKSVQQYVPRVDSTQPIKEIRLKTTHKILAIGASTGGTQAIERVLMNLPALSPGTVIVQHMPEGFTAAFAQRLNHICPMEVREARDQDDVIPGTALIAPGNQHMLLMQNGARYYVKLKNGPHVHHQKPSVDVLFHSVAKNAGRNAIGVILTGMGSDGAQGLKAMHENNAKTIAQDENSCVVFGMPKQAIKLDAVDMTLPLDEIPNSILNCLTQ